MHYVGIVEDINDPLKIGRVRVRIYGIHDASLSEIKTEDLPWSHVMTPTTTPGISGLGQSPFLVQGSTVVLIEFDPFQTKQTFIVLGTLPTSSLYGQEVNPEEGFRDPDGVYPIFPGTADIDSRAQGVVGDNPSLGTLNHVRTVSPNYPNNHVFATKKGHIKEYDDSDLAPRIYEKHSSGSFYEIGPTGSKVTKIVNNNYTLILGDDEIEVQGTVSIKSHGSTNIEAAGNVDIKSDGSTLINSSGSISVKSGGAMHIQPGSDITIKTFSAINLEAHDAINIKETANSFCTVDPLGNLTQSDCVAAGGEWKLQTKPIGIHIESGNNIELDTNSSIKLTTKSTGGDITLTSEHGNIHLDTPNGVVHLNQNH